MPNPFMYGPPVPPDQFVDRWQEVRRIVGRILNQGQSTAIVGEPRSGKTSLLLYLAAPEMQNALYGPGEKRLAFSFVDNQALTSDCDQAKFWETVLQPVYEKAVHNSPDPSLTQAYETCRDNGFGTFTLERLLTLMSADGWRLVLLLDEFDALLHHEQLNCAEFFGGLRSLASRSRGALAITIASRRPLAALNEATQTFSRTGSPYFNFLSEIILGPLPNKHVANLLNRAGNRFTPVDRRLIETIGGGHPYLLQVAAAEMWEAYAEGIDDAYTRWKQVGTQIYEEATTTLEDIWRLWSPQMRMALTAAALPQLVLEERKFRDRLLIHDLRDLGPELRALEKQGFVIQDNESDEWRVRPMAFVWWLADEVVRMARDETSYRDWLRAQEFEGVLTRAQEQKLGKALNSVSELLKDGAKVLIESIAKGAANATIGG